MKTSRKILIASGIIVIIPVLLFVAFYLYAWIYYSGHDQLATFDLPPNNKLRVFNDRQWDIGYGVFCQLDGPQFHHEAHLIAGILYPDLPPKFTLHTATNRQVFWLTPATKPGTVLYVVDVTTGRFWPDPREDWERQLVTGDDLLKAVGITNKLHSQWGAEYVGVKGNL